MIREETWPKKMIWYELQVLGDGGLVEWCGSTWDLPSESGKTEQVALPADHFEDFAGYPTHCTASIEAPEEYNGEIKAGKVTCRWKKIKEE